MDYKKLKKILNQAITRWNGINASRANTYLAYAIQYYKLNEDERMYLYSNFNKYTSKHPSNYDLEVSFTINGVKVA